MEKDFTGLGVVKPIVDAIGEMGFELPTKVQHDAIPYILDQKDLIVMSKTGSGKTGAFGIPVIQNVDAKVKKPQGLILTPTRELAVQIDDELKKMSKHMELSTAAVYGQHSINTEISELKRGAAVITGTPGRVFDHISKHTLDTKEIKYLVLDEADRMLDMGFFDQVLQIIKTLPRERVTLLFSATMPPEIQRICKKYMKEPITLELGSDTKTVDTITQIYYRVEPKQKRTWLNNLLKIEKPDSCIIFCNTRTEVDWVYKYFRQKGYEIGALHGGNTQSSRMKTINRFKEGKLQIIVATDVAARGIHIDELSLVVNYDVPGDKDSYIHRIGRTGRVGNSGKAITLVTVDDIWSFYEIEEHVGTLIEEMPLPDESLVKECEKNLEDRWTKRRQEKALKLKSTTSKDRKNDKEPNRQRKNNTDYHDRREKKSHATAKPTFDKPAFSQPTHNKGPKTVLQEPIKAVDNKQVEAKHEVKHEPKKIKPEIDYRLEAKKLLGQTEKEDKSLFGRIKKIFKGE